MTFCYDMTGETFIMRTEANCTPRDHGDMTIFLAPLGATVQGLDSHHSRDAGTK